MPLRNFPALPVLSCLLTLPLAAQVTGPATWQDDLAPITKADWNAGLAAHLLERAGFGGTPEEIERLARMTPKDAVKHMVRFDPDGSGHAGVRAFRRA